MIQASREGLVFFTEDSIASIKNFLLSQIDDDGGFCGRDGRSDLYYSVFGLQLCAIFDLMPPKNSYEYFEKFTDSHELDFIHLASLVRCIALLKTNNKNWVKNLIAQIEGFRSADGGYNHLAESAERGTAYADFLSFLVYRAIACKIPEPGKMLASLEQLKRPDGSYANDCKMESGSTTATSAAVVLSNEFGKKVDNETVDALLDRQHPQGGFLAGPNSPVPDLLSTATALYALRSFENRLPELNGGHRDFVASLWNEDGGFSGQVFDDVSDVEYTFYALLGLGII